MSVKRIFNISVANFLIQNKVELVEIRIGEVEHKPERATYLFKKDERLAQYLKEYKAKHN